MREDEHVPVTDDDDAIKRCQQGDIEGLATLIRRYQTDALRLAYLLTGDRYLAEDIVQDGFLQVYRAAARFHLGRPFQPWFHQIVANTTRIRRRSASRRHEVSLDGMLREPGRSINFHVAPQTFSGVTVQPLRLDIGGKGNDFDYLGSGERLILRVSGLAPDTRRSTVANISFKFFDRLGAGQAGGEANQLLFEGQRPAGVAGMYGELSLAQDPVVGPSGTIDLEVIFLGLPQLTGTQTLALTQLATAKNGDTFSFANGNWFFELPLG